MKETQPILSDLHNPVPAPVSPRESDAETPVKDADAPEPDAQPTLSLVPPARKPTRPRAPRGARLRPGMRADEAVRIIARGQLSRMLENHTGAILDLDAKYLHDFRVSVRRSRSLMTQVKGVLPRDVSKRFARQFAWLAQATGPCRDHDVILERLDEYKSVVSASLAAGAERLESELVRRRTRAHVLMVDGLSSNRFVPLIREWRAFLESPLPLDPPETNAARPVIEVADERIRRKVRRAFSLRRTIDAETPLKRLHELRLQLKKLRYLIEFFRDLYPRDQVAAAITQLKRIQDDLGALNDARIHREMLIELGRDLGADGKPSAEALLAAGEIIQFLGREVDRMRVDFARHFHRFARPKNRKRYARIVEARGGVGR